MAGVLIDTGYIIALAKPTEPKHDDARKYWKYFTADSPMPIYLSTIVVSEFSLRQPIPDYILQCCIVLPFNYDDAIRAAEFDWTRNKPEGEERTALKDDMKIIAQAAGQSVDYVITRDPNTFLRYCETLREEGKTRFRTININDGFDLAHFSQGQGDLLTREDV